MSERPSTDPNASASHARGMSGFDLARLILAQRPQLPVLMTSGYMRPEDRDAALRAGIREVIAKPNIADEIGRTLDKVLARARAQAPGAWLPATGQKKGLASGPAASRWLPASCLRNAALRLSTAARRGVRRGRAIRNAEGRLCRAGTPRLRSRDERAAAGRHRCPQEMRCGRRH
jgi:DNA-binding NarL/FixJ family response regulator